MKIVKKQTKLSLNKEVLTKLSVSEMNNIKGGITTVPISVVIWPVSSTVCLILTRG